METVLYAVLILAGLGAVLGLVLAIASKVFAVETDARLEPLTEALPGANCGGCGFSGCGAYAQAVIDGKAKPGLCAPGGQEVADKMAKVLGIEAEKTERMVAMVRCRHKDIHHKGQYAGLQDCVAAARLAGGSVIQCEYGCMGFGTCAAACKFDAIHIVDGTARVDADKCTGCLACAAACPKKLIVPVPYHADINVACANHDKGAITRKVCDIGCIACRMCEKICPNDAIHVIDNLSVIDHAKCVSCGLCAEKCPRHLIVDSNLRKDCDIAPAMQR